MATFAPALEGGFVRITSLERALAAADPSPFTGPTDTSAAVVVDLDGDGLLDVIYSHLNAGSFMVRQAPAGTFTSVGPVPFAQGNCLLSSDLDGDGFTDIFCTRSGGQIFWGGAKGPDMTQMSVLHAERDEMAVTVWDVDEDGLLDLIEAPFGLDKVALRNTGNRRFEDTTAAWQLGIPGLTWAVGFVDFDGDGRQDIYVANDGDGKKNYALKALGPGAGGEPGFMPIAPMPADCDSRGFFSFGDVNPMGMALGQLADDGKLELFLASSGPPPILAPQSDGTWEDVAPRLAAPVPVTSTMNYIVPWTPLFWDADHDGYMDIVFPTGDDIGHSMKGNRGDSHVVFWRGKPDLKMDPVDDRIGLDQPGQFMTMNPVDIDGDGDLDLLFGGFAQGLVAWENRLAPHGQHVLLSLRGHASNPLGYGARVEVAAGAMHRVYQMGDRFGPRLTTRPQLDVALGPADHADELRIHWPSGYDQLVRGLPAGVHTVDEPPLFTVAPPTRHAPADGRSTFVFSVRPVDELGAPRAAAKVAIAAPFHPDAHWAGPEVAQPDGSTTRTLVAPSAAGTVVVQISVDGKAYKVRPRVWFD